MKVSVGTKLASQGTKKIYKILELIGRGAHGEVFKAKDCERGEVFAIKIIVSTNKEHASYVLREIEMLRLAGESCGSRAPRFHEAFQICSSILSGRDVHTCVVMEYIDGVSLSKLISVQGLLHESAASYIVLEICQAVSALHHCSLVHRDIKSQNIMIDREGNVKVCDFGVSKALLKDSGLIGTVGGTPFWMAPEILRGDRYNELVDIFSLGIVFIELVTGSHPVPPVNSSTNTDSNSLAQASRMTQEHVLSVLNPKKLSSRTRSIIAKCVEFDPRMRYDASSLISAIQNYISTTTKQLLSPNGTYSPKQALSNLIKQSCFLICLNHLLYKKFAKISDYCLQYTAHL